MSAQAIGKPAITHYRILDHYRGHTLIECQLETGRTHQIRVHMNFIHHPLFGDSTYGWRLKLPSKMVPELAEELRQFKRQALHAKKLELTHPKTEKRMVFECDYPEDFEKLIKIFKEDQKQLED